jgi:hypothetical protein
MHMAPNQCIQQYPLLPAQRYRWRHQMLEEPVAVAVGLERWSAVRAWLSNTRVPLASLQLTAADGRAAQQVQLRNHNGFASSGTRSLLQEAPSTCVPLASLQPMAACAKTDGGLQQVHARTYTWYLVDALRPVLGLLFTHAEILLVQQVLAGAAASDVTRQISSWCCCARGQQGRVEDMSLLHVLSAVAAAAVVVALPAQLGAPSSILHAAGVICI